MNSFEKYTKKDSLVSLDIYLGKNTLKPVHTILLSRYSSNLALKLLNSTVLIGIDSASNHSSVYNLLVEITTTLLPNIRDHSINVFP